MRDGMTGGVSGNSSGVRPVRPVVGGSSLILGQPPHLQMYLCHCVHVPAGVGEPIRSRHRDVLHRPCPIAQRFKVQPYIQTGKELPLKLRSSLQALTSGVSVPRNIS